ncbi:helix-turn-helix domain-containing protein [Citricoccus muralis]|uniref:Helix-turn-helix transcriptional regulator n=1 Tax=Citricoccus muralis TaxID=169134 RepID=A0ABY8H6C0_9MICC|nr:helix-turn-helix transcriptional regulator [Citricoccus muralis]WFP16686.1 helix-turn-helix transcriptional regulator [Citricoccus muralis]
MSSITAAINTALEHSTLSQRALAEKTGISQPTLNRILTGAREAKLPEIILIADATGCTVAQLTGTGVSERVECVARATNGSGMDTMRQRLLHFMELDAYLDDQAIPAP